MTLLYPDVGALRTDTNSWFTAATGSYSDLEKRQLNNLLANYDAESLLSKLDRCFLMHFGKNIGDALLSIVGLGTATAVNSPTFTAGAGITRTGSSYVNTNYNPATATNYQQNSSAVGWYIRTHASITTNPFAWGASTASSVLNTFHSYVSSGNVGVTRMNQGNTGGSTGELANASSPGHYLSTRTAVDAARAYRNASVTPDFTDTSTGIPSLNIFLFGRNLNGALERQYANAQMSYWFAGSGFTTSQYNTSRYLLDLFADSIGFSQP